MVEERSVLLVRSPPLDRLQIHNDVRRPIKKYASTVLVSAVQLTTTKILFPFKDQKENLSPIHKRVFHIRRCPGYPRLAKDKASHFGSQSAFKK